MKHLKYDGGATPRGASSPGAHTNPALTSVSLGILSLLGTVLLFTGGFAWFMGDDTPILPLGRNAALALMIAGGALDAAASVLLVRHQRASRGDTAA